MAWEEANVVEQRFEFVLRARRDEESMSGLCREYGISRKTGYKWLNRFKDARSVTALHDRSRRPRRMPQATPGWLEERVVELRQKHGWSGRKLRRLLLREGIEISRSTIDRIIKRRGLVLPEDRRRPAVKRFERSKPNELWQMDFKGEYVLKGVERCYPLSVLDDNSRYLVGLKPLRSPGTKGVLESLVGLFEEFGVPDAMLMDHGAPWWGASNGHGLTRLSVELIKQGIRLIYGAIAHPQTQGKVERFHHTLARALRHRGGVPQDFDLLAIMLAAIRHEYNEVRPHEALGDETPATLYRPSTRPYQPVPPEWVYPDGADVRYVDKAGCCSYQGQRYFVCMALKGEPVWSRRIDGLLVIVYRHMYVREIDLKTGRTRAVVRPACHQDLLPLS
jgi:transposase InsO family protein